MTPPGEEEHIGEVLCRLIGAYIGGRNPQMDWSTSWKRQGLSSSPRSPSRTHTPREQAAAEYQSVVQ